MVGTKNKKNDTTGLGPEFEVNPYEKLDDMLFNPDLEYIVSVEDDYLKIALAQFLNDNNLQQKTKNYKEYEYMFISFDLGTFNFIEKPTLNDKKLYELPYDWDELMISLRDYLEENPFEKKEEPVHNQESWSQPINSNPKQPTHNDGKSFMERAKAALTGSKDGEEKDNSGKLISACHEKVLNTNDELKSLLKSSDMNENFKSWSEDGDSPLVKDDSGNHNGGSYDINDINASDDIPHTIASIDFENGKLTTYIEITKPFKAYWNDEYDVTEYIEFENGDVYELSLMTPMESQSYEVHGRDMMEENYGKAQYDYFESVNKIVDELIM